MCVTDAVEAAGGTLARAMDEDRRRRRRRWRRMCSPVTRMDAGGSSRRNDGARPARWRDGWGSAQAAVAEDVTAHRDGCGGSSRTTANDGDPARSLAGWMGIGVGGGGGGLVLRKWIAS
ncbi:hypothetical protein OsI_29651 [Oryza sativa Indica Group]|nr:hypothetical protein OsI_29651 [Oryza sativa Indica Group]